MYVYSIFPVLNFVVKILALVQEGTKLEKLLSEVQAKMVCSLAGPRLEKNHLGHYIMEAYSDFFNPYRKKKSLQLPQ